MADPEGSFQIGLVGKGGVIQEHTMEADDTGRWALIPNDGVISLEGLRQSKQMIDTTPRPFLTKEGRIISAMDFIRAAVATRQSLDTVAIVLMPPVDNDGTVDWLGVAIYALP